MKHVEIYTDGSCLRNPGPGGWAALLRSAGRERLISGGNPATTNNRMELQAAIEALQALKEPCEVDLHTDSQYVRKGISDYIKRWKTNGWKTSAGKAVLNKEFWVALDTALTTHTVRWHWVRAHNGHADNERVDQAARAAAEAIRDAERA